MERNPTDIERMADTKVDYSLLLRALDRIEPVEPSRRAQFRLIDAILASCTELTDLDAPISLGIKISARCNLVCRHCWAYPATYTRQPTLAELLTFIESARELGVLRIVLTGGEPLLRPDVERIVARIKELGFFLEIFTNGTNTILPRYTKVIKYLTSTTDMIQLSLDGPTPQTHGAQRPGASSDDFQAIEKAIHFANDARVTTRVNMTATPMNVSTIAETYDSASAFGATCFRVNPVFPIGRAIDMKNEINLSFAQVYLTEVTKCVHSRPDSATEFDFAVPWVFFQNAYSIASDRLVRPRNVHCFSGAASWEVLPNGDTYTSASSIYEESLKIGNVFEEKLEAMWNKKLTKIFRRGRNLADTKCYDCKFLGLCQGGREEAAYLRYGSVDFPDPSCTLTPM